MPSIINRLLGRSNGDGGRSSGDGEDGLYLLGHISFSVFPRDYNDPNRRWENSIFASLTTEHTSEDAATPPLIRQLEGKLQTSLGERIGRPVEVRLAVRRGTIVLEAAFLLGAYTLLKDYKDLRESTTMLKQDVRNVLGLPDGWRVEAEVHTPGPLGRAGGSVGMGMDMISRYAFLYLMITNIVLILAFGFIVWTIVAANV